MKKLIPLLFALSFCASRAFAASVDSGSTSQASTPSGSPVPQSVIQVGGSDGTNLEPLSVDSLGRLITVSHRTGGDAVAPPVVVNVMGTIDSTGVWNALYIDEPSGGLKIHDGGNIITVDGTVTITDGSGPITVDGTVSVSGLTFSGSQVLVKESSAGAPDGSLAGLNALQIAGTDGSALRTIATDSDGRIVLYGGSDGGSSAGIMLQPIAGWDPGNLIRVARFNESGIMKVMKGGTFDVSIAKDDEYTNCGSYENVLDATHTTFQIDCGSDVNEIAILPDADILVKLDSTGNDQLKIKNGEQFKPGISGIRYVYVNTLTLGNAANVRVIGTR